MTVSATQIKAAQAHGLINVTGLAAACDKLKFPFHLACAILDKETDGRNIFGHDKRKKPDGTYTTQGVAFSGPDNINIEVTEERYKEFLRLIDTGSKSNGVGAMQLTYRGYHIGPESLTAKGLKAWEAADNILYGVSLLAHDYKAQLAKGLSAEKAFWNTAKIFNGGSLTGPAGTSYADDAIVKARTWAATVGSADMEVDVISRNGLDINSKMHANARHVTEEVLEHFPAIQVIWTYAGFPDHSNCRCTDYMITIEGMARADQVKLGDAIANYLIANADRVGLNWLIWNRRIYRHQNTDKGHGWADYTGPKPHTDHVHMEVDDRTYKPPEDDMPTAKEIIDELIKRGPQVGAALAKGYLSADIVPSGKDEPDPANKTQVPATFIRGDHDLLYDIRELLKEAAKPEPPA